MRHMYVVRTIRVASLSTGLLFALCSAPAIAAADATISESGSSSATVEASTSGQSVTISETSAVQIVDQQHASITADTQQTAENGVETTTIINDQTADIASSLQAIEAAQDSPAQQVSQTEVAHVDAQSASVSQSSNTGEPLAYSTFKQASSYASIQQLPAIIAQAALPGYVAIKLVSSNLPVPTLPVTPAGLIDQLSAALSAVIPVSKKALPTLAVAITAAALALLIAVVVKSFGARLWSSIHVRNLELSGCAHAPRGVSAPATSFDTPSSLNLSRIALWKP